MPVEDTPAPETLTTLAGRYEIVGLLGSGGMGSVYRVRDTELEEMVALKLLHPRLMQRPADLDRFRQEVKLARRVTHPNVARMFDIGEHAGQRFLTMELVEGQTLRAVISEEAPMEPERIGRLFEPICCGLAAVHGAGVLHRDLKPENVLIGNDGRVLLTDFGIARLSSSDERGLVETGFETLGTPLYMAPEQVEQLELDIRADVYSLGTILYEMLTGQPAWHAPSPLASAMRRLQRPPPDPREASPQVPDCLAEVVLRCLARERDDRYGDALAVRDALLDAIASISAQDHPRVARAPALPRAELEPRRGTHRLAVLPFRAREDGDAHYGAGLAEDLIDSLSTMRGISVRSRGAVAALALPRVDGDPVMLGRELSVDVLVAGSIRRDPANAFRVTARLHSVGDGFQIWSRVWTCSPSEILALADWIAAAIAETLSVPFEPSPTPVPVPSRALDLYLRARLQCRDVWRGERDALDLMKQAAKAAPDNPSILAEFALALARVFAMGEVDVGEACVEVAQRALHLAPQMAKPLVALAVVSWNAGECAEAGRLVRRALMRAPRLAEAREAAGRLLVEVGSLDEAIEHLLMAHQLEPAMVQTRISLAKAYAFTGRWEEAFEHLAVADDAPLPLLEMIWPARVRLTFWCGDIERARRYCTELARLEFQFSPYLLIALQALLRHEDALLGFGVVELDRHAALAGTPRVAAFFHQCKVELAMVAGIPEAAVAALEQSVAQQLLDINWVDRCPLLEPLRGSPRFASLRASVALRAEEVLAGLRGADHLGSAP